MPGLLLPPRRNRDTEKLSHAAFAAGWDREGAPSYQTPAYIFHSLSLPVTVYGDPLFVDLAADALKLSLLEPPLEWLPNLPEEFLRRRVRLTTLAEARAFTEPTFIKPAEDKSFPAMVYATSEKLAAVTEDLPETMPLLISEPVSWGSEFRVFVHARKVAAVSIYFRDGRLARSMHGPEWDAPAEEIEAATRFAERVLAVSGDALPEGVVVDVGIIAGKEWAVVEANPAWASGLYGCDPNKVLECIAASMYPRDAVPESQQRFVRAPIAVER